MWFTQRGFKMTPSKLTPQTLAMFTSWSTARDSRHTPWQFMLRSFQNIQIQWARKLSFWKLSVRKIFKKLRWDFRSGRARGFSENAHLSGGGKAEMTIEPPYVINGCFKMLHLTIEIVLCLCFFQNSYSSIIYIYIPVLDFVGISMHYTVFCVEGWINILQLLTWNSISNTS